MTTMNIFNSSLGWGGGLLVLAAAMMLATGTLNTILMKFMVMQKVPTSEGAEAVTFDHPYFQTMLMVTGEFLCLLAYAALPKSSPSSLDGIVEIEPKKAPDYIFALPSVCDWVATSLVHISYLFIAASVAQMTRGTIVIFTFLLSIAVLKRRQFAYHFVGVSAACLGITLVSLSTIVHPATFGLFPSLSSSFSSSEASAADEAARSVYKQMFGIFLCIFAQVFHAAMLVYEEKIMSQYDLPPLKVVGMEGLFGISFGLAILLILNGLEVESTPTALYQLRHSTTLLLTAVGAIFSIALFNFAGVTVTKEASATARATIDVARTISVWFVELVCGWNIFNPLQLLGFLVLAAGTLLYNRLIVVQMFEPTEECQALLTSSTKLSASQEEEQGRRQERKAHSTSSAQAEAQAQAKPQLKNKNQDHTNTVMLKKKKQTDYAGDLGLGLAP
mmetsp:Transcript_22674/g.49833  ORF Transcript_22674/g.49833 Transcript_22674/m.49833 type:complete len:446 (+) Transcript_22674:256-1593(+)|eukprot:CAMPEP_0206451912 /NCGR_PEP_ID=MMETSP0324_2-20121206/19627_1 /ASSEMBLY_ACC=CAM_ASM_000836 /TAXON_ID=2866 /ORGANISM="Crypthecodinium cohnii, Strain Seligo" /LENGTH=445 /DNA_ID=CAMNT_0053921891 /DNA_START=168 /DNA_END=1505 /DNA_ORIENTATION=+